MTTITPTTALIDGSSTEVSWECPKCHTPQTDDYAETAMPYCASELPQCAEYRWEDILTRHQMFILNMRLATRCGEHIFQGFIDEHGGNLMPFRDLPADAQNAIIAYMTDGGAWTDDLVDIFYRDLDTDSLYATAREKAMELFGNEIFGYIADVPTKSLSEQVLRESAENGSFIGDDFPSFSTIEESNAWYVANTKMPDHGSSVWPVILSSSYGEFLQDGWHRYHSYILKGIERVPIVYIPPQINEKSGTGTSE